jgi:hypothetical protein
MGEWLYRSIHSETSVSRLGRFTPREGITGTHQIGGWVGPGTGLDDEEGKQILRLLGFELRPVCRPSCSQPLYRLSRLPSDLMEDKKKWNVSETEEGRSDDPHK